jgi:hypothetical protein
METKGINKALFKKGNKIGAMKRKKITYSVNENGCHVCTSHKLTKAGYAMYSINGKEIYMHRYIYKQKYGKIPVGMEICHKCDNPACINENHLFLGTHLDNMKDRTLKGRDTIGEKNGCSKLTEKEVKQIKSLNYMQQNKLSEIFNVSQPTISAILNNRRWAHI